MAQTRTKRPAPGPAGPQDFAWLPLAALRPWDRNPRKNKRAVAPVAASIQRFGFVAPVVIWLGGNRMVAGHTRLKALRQLLEQDAAFVPRGAPGSGMVPVRVVGDHRQFFEDPAQIFEL